MPAYWQRWHRVVQVLSDLSTAYQRDHPDRREYDACAAEAHDLSVELGIPYGDAQADEEE